MEQIWTTAIGKQNGIDLLNAHAQWHYGEIEPNPTYPFQNWADTANNLWKQRNEVNTDWIIRGVLNKPLIYNRNAIINGNGIIQQRSSVVLSTTAQYGIDRWAAYCAGTAISAGTFGQTTACPIGRSGYGIAANNVTITGSGILYKRYRIEAKDAVQFINQSATFSCLVYHDAESAIDYTVTVNKASTVDTFSTVTAISSQTTSVSGDTSTKLSFTIVDMGACQNGIEILISMACGAITTKNFYLTEAQFELGTVSTNFEYRLYQQELALCQRYFEKSFDLNVAPVDGAGVTSPGVIRLIPGGLYGFAVVNFIVPKRAIPNITLYNPHSIQTNKIYNINGATHLPGATERTSRFSTNILVNEAETNIGDNVITHFTANAEL